MKWNCELIQDLLPLYEEGLCSPASKSAVEEHLAECEACRRLTKALPIPQPQTPGADRAVAKGIRTVRRRWLTSLVAALLLLPILLLSVNQYRGSGLCFTNVDDILTARRFLSALERQDWSTAAAMHDYSGDYESILEALALPMEDWGPSFNRVIIDGEAYMLNTHIVRDYGTPESAAELFGFLYNRWGNVMISPALWDRICAVEPGAVTGPEGRKQELNGEWYARISTPWGDFITTQGEAHTTAAEYCHVFVLLPACVYEQAKTDLEAERRQLYESTHAAYDYVADMTETEFIDCMERRYAADLASLEDSITFVCTGFRGSYRSGGDGSWHIQLGVQLTFRGKTLDTTMAVSVAEGRVFVASISYVQSVDWLDQLNRILYPSAHPDY